MSSNKIKAVVTALEGTMLENAGVKSVTVDGQVIVFEDKLKLKELIDVYKRELAAVTRPRKSLFVSMDLSSMF